MEGSFVQNVLDDILQNPSSLSRADFEKKYPDFFNKYPTLSEKVFDPDFDTRTMRYLLAQKAKIDANKQTEYDASVKVGSMLVDRYVKPHLNA